MKVTVHTDRWCFIGFIYRSWLKPSPLFFFMSLFTVCSPSTHVLVSQEFSRNLMTPQVQKLRQFIWEYMRSFRVFRIQLCVLVHFDYFLPLLHGKGGDKIYTPNLSSSLLRDKQKMLILGFSKRHSHTFCKHLLRQVSGPGAQCTWEQRLR